MQDQVITQSGAKTCVACGETKLRASFRNDYENFDGKANICRACQAGGRQSARYLRYLATPDKDGFLPNESRNKTTADGEIVRFCRGCKHWLNVALFSPDVRTTDRLRYWCEQCASEPYGVDGKLTSASEASFAVCRQCHERKPLDSFVKNKRWTGGRESLCKACCNKRSRSSYHLNRVHRRESINKRIAEQSDSEKWYWGHVRYVTRFDIPVELTHDVWMDILSLHGGLCARCRDTRDIHVDHIVPLTKGGRDVPSNVEPMCPACNAIKGNAVIADFRQRSCRLKYPDRMTTFSADLSPESSLCAASQSAAIP
jgi:5-methylcytosine-specific restriction endonuclease McrA